MIILISFIIVLILIVYAFIIKPKFGKRPSGERLKMIKNSPNFKNGKFQNYKHTPVMIREAEFFKVLKDFIFSKNKPNGIIPSIKTDLLNLERDKDILVWFGHSSYFIQIDGKKILIDPVFSGHASPFSFTTKAFKGSDAYKSSDIPEIDYLFITHDHWDHLDYETILKLKPKIKKVICGLGVAEHLVYWGYDSSIIIEKDWNEKIVLETGFNAYTVPSRHFSGRGFVRNKTLWTSFILQTPEFKIFISCDGGYDTHFSEIGEKFGEFDLAIMENGQYNKNWKYIHMMPEQVIEAAKDLKAMKIIPGHSSKFALSIHEWDEPLKRIMALSKQQNFQLLTPMIGEQVNLKDSSQKFSEWWKDVK